MVLEQAARPVVVAEAVPPEEGRFRTDIEGLRAVAILLVVLYHIGLPIIGGGYVGVDVFFVISGFLITTQLYRELDRTGTISIVGFYAKRIARLLPAATLTIAVTVAAAWFWMPPTRFHSIAIDGVCAALYGINYRLASAGIVYLGASEPPSPLQNFWSLAVEEQFYVVWPLLLLAAATWWRRRRGRVPGRRVLVVPLVVLAVASFALSVAQTVSAAPWAFFGAPARAWELATGAVIALVVPRLERIGRWLAWGLQAAGIVVIVAAGVLYRDTMAFPGYLATVPVLGAAAVIIAGCQRRHWTPVGWLLARPAMQRIGKLSYSWYLWHWPVLIVVPIAVGLPPNLGWNLLLAVWSLALAAVCNALVEDPVRFSRVLRRRPWRSVRLGLVLSATVAVAAGAAIIWLPLRTIPVDTSERPVDNLAEMVAQPTFGERDLARIIQASTQIKTIPQNLSPRLDLALRDFPVMYTDGCDPPLTSSAIQDKCVYGDPASNQVVVLFGDSHAGHWFPALDAVAKQRHWKLIPYSKSACSAASVLIRLKELKREYTECVAWRNTVVERLKALHPFMVIMSSVGDGGVLIGGGKDIDRSWTDKWMETVARVKPFTSRVVLIADTPWPAVNVPDCVSSHPHDVSACSRPVSEAIAKPHRREMVNQAASRAGVSVIDPTAWFCWSKTCPVIIGNTLVYRDASHVSAVYAALLAPVLWERLK